LFQGTSGGFVARIFGFCPPGRAGRGGTRAAGALPAAGLLVASFGSAAMAASVPHDAASVAGSLGGVACASTSSCVVVGVRTGSSGSGTLAEKWSGTKWSVVTSPNPKGSTGAGLGGVACTSAKNCLAVGRYFMPGKTLPTAEKWNGAKWSVVKTPTSKSGQLVGDGCFNASACMAIGIGNKLFAIAQAWKGSAWAATTPAKPSGATTSELNGVSCPAASACEAAGTYSTSASSPALAEGWNGKAWTLQKTPAISGSTYASLANVACPAKTGCWAVGQSFKGSTGTPVIERWNGKSWSLTAS
jgi:hypothetical protein